MPTRHLEIDGRTWAVYPSGYITQYDADEFGLLFVHGTGEDREVRVTRYSPGRTRSREQALAEMSDADVRRLSGCRSPASAPPRPVTPRDG